MKRDVEIIIKADNGNIEAEMSGIALRMAYTIFAIMKEDDAFAKVVLAAANAYTEEEDNEH